MALEENGVVIDRMGGIVLVRALKGSQCAGCCADKFCHPSGSGQEKVVEAENGVGVKIGQKVVLAVPSGALFRASFVAYMVPVLGLLVGAGIAQFLVGRIASPEVASMAAGIGGIAGAALAIAFGRRYQRRQSAEKDLRPRVVRIVG